MTAKSRVRKQQKKLRRVNDVNPKPGNLREADPREEAQRSSRPVAIQLDGKARLQGVSLVREGEGTGYIIEVGDLGFSKHPDLTVEEQLLYDIFASPAPQEAVRAEASPDAAPLVERGASEASGQPHLVYFEAEVNGAPTHIESEDCFCGLDLHHWREQGEH
jgi:hypothetical protein